eukprot:NODE_338_length_2074_cov_124.116076_g332_i0.p1 GENE.NODE_338_length_2074_cov_124.116076_g332_i0~~NODE_338_length_2074_cov_124.116076_g332_i0.p1  ORF type:complete len:643 (-),score=143.31 NODE_338_length_2074_cov_124.116076_g332_i0:61-1989(-)
MPWPLRPRVWMDFGIGSELAGRVIFELHSDTAPKAAEHFRCMCTGERGSLNDVTLSYKGSDIFRVQQSVCIQGGDIDDGMGNGGWLSVYGECFEDENLRVQHVKGSLSLVSRGPNTNGTQFIVCADKIPSFDGKHQVVGNLVDGFSTLDRVQRIPLGANNYPAVPVVVLDCGELEVKPQSEADFMAVMREQVKQGKFAAAQQTGTDGLAKHEDSSELRFMLAQLFHYHLGDDAGSAEERRQTALSFYTKLLSLHPGHQEGLRARADLIHYVFGDIDRAMQQYTVCVDEGAATADVYNNRAECHIASQQYDEAFRDLEQALGLQPNHERALAHCHLLMAMKKVANEEEPAARAAAEETESSEWASLVLAAKKGWAKVSKPSMEHYLARVDEHIANEKYPDACQLATEGLKHYSDCSRLYYLRGLLYHKHVSPARCGDALQDYNTALNLNSALTDAHRNRADLLLREFSDPTQALPHYNKAIEQGLDDPETWFNHAECLVATSEEWDAALEGVDKCLAALPEHAGAIALREVIVGKLHDKQRAAAELELNNVIATLPVIEFEKSSAELDGDDVQQLDAVAHMMQQYPFIRLKVAGVTTNQNLTRLAGRRAQVAADYIVKLGVARDRLETEATFGSEKAVLFFPL